MAETSPATGFEIASGLAQLEPCEEMEATLENEARQGRVQPEMLVPIGDAPAEPLEGFPPSGFWPVIVRQHHAMGRIAEPVHQSERRSGEKPVPEMILDDDRLPADSLRLA